MRYRLLATTTGRKPELNKMAQERFMEREKLIEQKLMKKLSSLDKSRKS